MLSLHGFTGLISACLGAIFAACVNYEEPALYKYYPARMPRINSNSTNEAAGVEALKGGLGRTAGEQAGFQLVALVITIGLSVVFGLATGFILSLPIFEKLSEDVEMFDDEAQWVTPDDYALKLTFASNNQQQQQQQSNDTETVENNQDTTI